VRIYSRLWDLVMCGRYLITTAPEAIRALFRYRELPNFQNLIAQRLQVLVLFAALPLLDFVHRLPAGDDHTLGSIACKAGDFDLRFTLLRPFRTN